MPDLIERCSVCHALLDEEDLFCANCGAEAPPRDLPAHDAFGTTTHSFECAGCGASMSYDASAQKLRCPFCGSEHLDSRPDTRSLAARRVVPMRIDRAAADERLRQWLGKGFWRPSDLSQRAAIEKIMPVYVPYWVFAARTFTYWTADTSKTPPHARGDWMPLAGEHQGEYAGLLIGASGVLTPAETEALCPFDLHEAVEPSTVDLENVIVEQFRVQRKYARPLARQLVLQLESQACEQCVPGKCRNLKVNVRLAGRTSEPVLLPVWIMAYRYQDQLYRFLMNGQTGRATGQAPTSWRKIAAAIAIFLFTIAALIITAALASR